jgi:hypothetical protein
VTGEYLPVVPLILYPMVFPVWKLNTKSNISIQNMSLDSLKQPNCKKKIISRISFSL